LVAQVALALVQLVSATSTHCTRCTLSSHISFSSLPYSLRTILYTVLELFAVAACA
jgi:hypothetical protein